MASLNNTPSANSNARLARLKRVIEGAVCIHMHAPPCDIPAHRMYVSYGNIYLQGEDQSIVELWGLTIKQALRMLSKEWTGFKTYSRYQRGLNGRYALSPFKAL